MTFNEALEDIKNYADITDTSVDIIIRFKTSAGEGSASLATKKYFKDRAETMMTVKRAWEYACKTDSERENGVTVIEIRPAQSITQKYAKIA